MRKSRLYAAFMVGAFAAGAITLASNSDENEAIVYTPRNINEATMSPEGAQELAKVFRGDVETGDVNSKGLSNMRDAVYRYASDPSSPRTEDYDLSWIDMGPDNVAGRTRSLVVREGGVHYAGAVSGGVWKSTDNAQSWERLEGLNQSLIVSALAMSGEGVLYAGTGSTFETASGNGDSGFWGNGVYKSSDDGATWELLPGTDNSNFNQNDDWSVVNQIEEDPIDPNKVWLATTNGIAIWDNATGTMIDPNLGDTAEGLIIGSTGFDLKLQKVPGENNFHGIVVFDGGRVFVSVDAGQNWEQVSSINGADGTLPSSSSSTSRGEVAISSSDPNHMYFLKVTGGAMGGVWHTSNAGQLWTQIWEGNIDALDPFGDNRQGFYDACIAVAPWDPEIAVVGGTTLWKCGPNTQPQQIAFYGGGGSVGPGLSVHADLHDFEWGPNDELYIVNDGGVYISDNQLETYYAANFKYNITQFYGIGISTSDKLIGGSQDNGTTFVPGEGFVTKEHGLAVFGGDGFECELSAVDDNFMIASSQFGVLSRSFEGGSNFGGFYGNVSTTINAGNGPNNFYSKVRIWENTEDDELSPYKLTVKATEDGPNSGDFNLFTRNLSQPMTVNIPENDPLEFYPLIERPEINSDEQLSGLSAEYPWLPAQTEVVNNTTEEVQVLVDTNYFLLETMLVDTFAIVGGDTIYGQIEQITNIPANEEDITEDLVEGEDYILEDVFETQTTTTTSYTYLADEFENEGEERYFTDPYTTLCATAVNINTLGDAIYVTRDALTTTQVPYWWIMPQISGVGTSWALEFSADGNVLYVGTRTGRVLRYEGFHNLWDEASPSEIAEVITGSVIHVGNGAVLGIGIDQNDNDHIVVTHAGYGGSNKVWESNNVTAEDPNFNAIWNVPSELNGMPVYDAIVDITDPTGNTIVIGTEFGVFVTCDGGDSWEVKNEGSMTRVPVFALRQQTHTYLERFISEGNSNVDATYGAIYAGTHGLGFMKSGDRVIVNVEEQEVAEIESSSLLVFPNPANMNTNVSVVLAQRGDVQLDIYSITGRFVKSITKSNLGQGRQQLNVSVEDLPTGNYILAVRQDGAEPQTAKFVVFR